MDAEVLFFFAGRPLSLELFQGLLARLAALSGAPQIEVRRTQISLRDHLLFACVSLPRRKADGGLHLSFVLPYRLDHPRVSAAVEPYPGRWTHHVLVSDAAALDGELLSWLGEARSFAAARS